MSTSRRRSAGSLVWGTAAARIKWLVEAKFDGNRSAMAKAIGYSHSIISRVVAGTKPGRRLREAVVQQLHVNPEWMERGVGQPFTEDRGIPVADMPLTGPLAANQAMLTDRVTVPEVVSSPTAYWLTLKSSQPIVKVPASGFRTGDHLLIETDPAKFPREADLRDRLCVVQAGAGGELRLAIVTYYPASMDDGPARLEAEFPEPVQSDQDVVERVYRHDSDGVVRYHERRLGQPEARHSEPTLPLIRYTDIVSVWLKILHRPV